MGRFGNLEFNAEFESESQRQNVVKDEAYYFAEARRAFEQGQFEHALRFYSKVLEFNPANGAAWTGQVRALIELGEYHEAKLWAEKALERFPNEPELLAAKAVALARGGDLQGAIAFSDASIEERGDTPYIWLARGDVLLARKERRADYCFEKALALAPRDWFIAWLAARIRYFYKQFTLALRLVQPALEWNPGQSRLWLLAGLCQKELRLIASARGSFSRALELDPHCSDTAAALADLSRAGLFAHLSGWYRQLFQR
jgi:tetratricopeptide (TPR) repeat protein